MNVDSFAQLGRGRLGGPEIARAAVAHADAEHRAAGRQQVDRGDRRRRDRGMSRHEVGHAHGHARAAHVLGQDRRRHPRIHRDARRVGDADHVVAERVRGLGHRTHQRDVVRPEEETRFSHG
jgi:hypothetical protein